MPVLPPTTSSYANKVIAVFDTPPSDPAAPTLAELNGATLTMLTCHIYGDLLVAPTQNKVDGNRKACSKTTPQKLGSVTYDVSDAQFSYVPQDMGSAGASGNEAIELLAAGSTFYFVEAPGLDGEATDSFTEGDVINLYHLECGEQRRGQTGDGEGDDFSFTQSYILVDGSEPQYDYVVPAA